MIWNIDSGEQIGRFDGHTRDVVAAIFTPDGQSLVSAGVTTQ
jgi:WD40 repeat protein